MASLDTVPLTGATTQAFTYTAGAPIGFFQGLSYNTFIGPLSLQGFTYDIFSVLLAATLLEDSDGIVAVGSGTCDVTPTIHWDEPSGSVGPFVYRWVLRHDTASGSVVTSGTTVNVQSATMPTLTPRDYYFTLTAVDGAGSTSELLPLVFQVIDCQFERSPNVTIIDPFDIEPVVPADEDYIRYLPQWMSVHGTATEPPSSSLTFRFLQPTLSELRKVERSLDEVSSQISAASVPVDLPRKAWHLQTRFNTRDVTTVNAVASGVITAVRRESSVYNFLTTDDPVFLLADNGHMLLRNLAQRQVLVAPVSGSTGATGSLLQLLSTQYQMPFEHGGIVPDSNVLFSFDGVEYRIKAGSRGVDPAQAVVQLTTPFSGSIRFRYQSETLADVVTVAISGNPAVTPSPTDLWNRLDELGLLCGVQRRSDEDNLSLKSRLNARFLSGKGVTLREVGQHIAQDLTLVDLLPWDGRSTLNLQSSGFYGVKYVDVDGLPQTDTITETLVPFGSNYSIYSSSKSDWHAGWVVFVNGRLATLTQYPGMVVSGNTVSFGTDVSGTIIASYGYDNYNYTRTSLDTITTVTPVGANALSGQYTAVLGKNVLVHTAADSEFIETNLLNANGTANGLFFDIRSRLVEGSPVLFGEARWGNLAHWLEETDQLPLTQHLPSIFDVGSGS